jgi:hypothetical protein
MIDSRLGCFRSTGGFIDLWELSCNLFEELLNIDACLCTHLFEINQISFSELPPLHLGDIPVFDVNFVGQEGDDDSFTPLVLDVIYPLLYAFKGTAVGDIVDDDGNRSITNVVGYQCFKPLLPCSIP